MSSLLNLIAQSLSGDNINQISQSIGESPEATKSAINEALPLMVGSLSKSSNASSGWSLLSAFLDKNKDGSIMDDLVGLAFQNSASTQNADALQQLLGGNQTAIAQRVESQTGLNMQSIAKLLPLLAPIIIGALAKVQKSQSFDQQGLNQFLEVESSQVASNAPQHADFLTSMLDANKDGSVVDDIAKHGAGFIGKLFSR